MRHVPRGLLDVPLRPVEQLPLELLATDRQYRRARRGDRGRERSAAQEAEAAVPRLHHVDRPGERLPRGPAVVDSNEDPVEHLGSHFA